MANKKQKPVVGIIMGSKSDWETMQHASTMLKELACRTSARSCRRTARRMKCFATPKGPRAAASR